MQTLNHLVPTLHLIKYTHATIMRSQNTTNTGKKFPYLSFRQKKKITHFSESESTTTTTSNTPSLHSLATKWWSQESQEGSIVRSDETVRKIMKTAGWGFDQAVVDDEGKVVEKEGSLLTNAKRAVEMLKQGGTKSDHWVV